MRNVADHVISIIDRITDYAIILFALILLLNGTYGIYDNYMIYADATDESLKQIRDSYAKENGDTGELLDSNVAWLTIDGTTIDYPVMQGENNSEFLNKDPYGNYTLSGSIFLDFRCNPDFSDTYSVVYGHHMAGGTLFGALDKYHQDGYLEEFREGEIIRKDGKEFKFHIFAVLSTDASDRVIFEMEYSDRAQIMRYTPDKAGTWVWQERPTQYTIKFVAPEGASGSMPDQKIKAAEAGTINPCEFKRFNYHFDRWIGNNGKTYADGQEIPANTFRAGYVLTLTGVMAKNENKVSFTEGVADIILHAGEKAIFPALPGGTLYQVMEETPSGWQIVDDLTRNTSGTIPANGTANAEFVNEYVPGTATVQLIALKTLDGRAPEDGAFTFCLKQNGEVIEEAANNATGVIMFKTLVFRQPEEYTSSL